MTEKQLGRMTDEDFKTVLNEVNARREARWNSQDKAVVAAGGTVQMAEEAREIGKEFGRQEASLWVDQHDGSMDNAPDWTRGTYSGRLPGDMRMDGEPLAIALEDAIDDEAEAMWNTCYRDDEDHEDI